MKNVKEPYKKNEFKISASTWNNEFGLHEASYSISNIQDIKKNWLKRQFHHLNE